MNKPSSLINAKASEWGLKIAGISGTVFSQAFLSGGIVELFELFLIYGVIIIFLLTNWVWNAYVEKVLEAKANVRKHRIVDEMERKGQTSVSELSSHEVERDTGEKAKE